MEQSTLYNARLDTWSLNHFTGDHLGDLSQKFTPDGGAKAFYGLTVVAFIESESLLHKKICDFQNKIAAALESAGVGHVFSMLEPLSFHMTICDIVAGSAPLEPAKLLDIVEAGRRLFPKLGMDSKLSCQLTGLGVDMSLVLLAEFESDASLKQCLHLEKQLKKGFQVDERSFLGHVSLAYFVQQPGTQLNRIKQVLAPFSEEALGEFNFNKISLCHFSDMNTYTPLISFDLLDRSFEHHPNNLHTFMPATESLQENHESLSED
ncbi:MAG: DUF1868 domain-containing protein [Candidatus Marinimicrobia bacterium]|nr:DUF1868 domain-containing protein [Candidatus Neomarinimicrobiota bacterium]